jgi:hypothetical protein
MKGFLFCRDEYFATEVKYCKKKVERHKPCTTYPVNIGNLAFKKGNNIKLFLCLTN